MSGGAVLSFDPNKNEKNIAKHGLALSDAQLFDFDDAIETVQNEDGEERIRALGIWNGEFVAVVVFVEYGDDDRHVISARRAEPQEAKEYVRKKSGT